MKRREFLQAAGGLLMSAHNLRAGNTAELQGARLAQGAEDPRFWQLVRAQFQLAPETAYLNTAGLGASPLAVTHMVKAMMDREEEAPSPGHSEEDWARIRTKCASFLGPNCSADEIAFVSTATEGINLILNGLGLRAGDEVITSTHEHVALGIPLLRKIQTDGIEVRTFEPDLAHGAGNLDRIRALITNRTRLIFISHVTCTTGQVFPVEEIGRFAAAANILFALDGAQSLCQFPIDIRSANVHFFTASGHKWMLGPKRTGILYIRKDRIDGLQPSIVGAYSDKTNSLPERHLELRPNAQRFEYGTQNDALIYGLEAAADFITALDLPTIWKHNQALNEECAGRLASIPGLKVLSPAESAHRSAMTTFKIEGRDNRQVAGALMQRHLRVRSVTEGGLDAVRVSFHVHNDDDEVRRLITAVREIAGVR